MKLKTIFASIFSAILVAVSMTTGAFANVNFSVSPPYEKITLIPGETYYGSLKVINPATSDADFNYELTVEPFYVDKDNNTVFEYKEDQTMMAKWLTLDHNTGTLSPNSSEDILFTIEVPENAPAGGQYASIKVGANTGEASGGGNLNITASYRMAHLIYAEVAGESTRKGAVESVNVPGFLFSGKITGTAVIENQGNVHGEATQKLQIFPLFSDEEVYTNEEKPETSMIMPGVKRSTSVAWDETPSIGIFHAVYNVDFEGATSSVDKIVIVCPLWLLFIVAVIIFLIIFKILSGKKERK